MAFEHREKMRLAVTGQAARMGTAQVALALGVPPERVTAWIRRGWLKARKRMVAGMPYYVINDEDLQRFLYRDGAVLEYLHPNEEWAAHVERGRAWVRSVMVDSTTLTALLGLSSGGMRHITNHKGFPQADIVHRLGVPRWYNRMQVRNWLVDNPRYDPHMKVREALRGGTN